MINSSLTNSSLTQLGSMLKSKQISSVEMTQEFLNRIAKFNPTINAYIALNDTKALAQAKADRPRARRNAPQQHSES